MTARQARQESPAITTHEGCAADVELESLRQSAQATDPAALEPAKYARYRACAIPLAGCGLEVLPRGAHGMRHVGDGAQSTCAAASGSVGIYTAGALKRNFGLNAVFASSSGLFLCTSVILFFGYRFFMRRDTARARAFDGLPATGP